MADSASDPNDLPAESHKELIEQAKEIQRDIDELRQAITQGHGQQLKPEYIEQMNELLVRLMSKLKGLFD